MRRLVMNKLLLICLFLCGISVFGQDVENDSITDLSELIGNPKNVSNSRVWYDNVDLDIEVDTLPQRLFEQIIVQKEAVTVEPQSYKSKSFDLELPKVKPNLKVYPIKDKAPQMPYGNMVNVGFGNYTTPYLEVFATSRKLTPLRYGTHLKHLSSSTGPVDKKNSAQSLNSAVVFADYFKDAWKLSSNIEYQRLGYNYFGYLDTLEDVNHDTLGVNYNIIHGGLKAVFLDTSLAISGNSYFDVYHTSNNYSLGESDFRFGISPQYKLKEHQRIVLDVDASIVNYTDTSSINRSWYSFKPYYSSKAQRVNFSAGLNIVFDNDSIYDKTAHLYPVIKANILIEEPHAIRFYTGITGGMERNTIRTTLVNMPYLASNALMYNTNNTFKWFVGVKGTLFDKLTLDIKGAYKAFQNMPMFINDSLNQAQFNIVYDDAKVFKLEGELMYHGVQNLDLSFNTVYRTYSLDTYEQAYHLPGLDMGLYTSYKIKNKVRLIADFYYLSSLYAYDSEIESPVQLANIIDLNLQGVYYFNNKMSAFLEFNNLLTKKYERYLHYNSKGLSFLAGISYSF